MDEVFRALAHPSRRRLLDRLFAEDGLSLGQLEPVIPELTRFGVMKHLRVLEAAGLVTTRRVGRERHHYLNPVPIRQIHDRWLDRYRARAAAVLLDLKTTLEEGDMDASAQASAPTSVFTVFVKSMPERIWRAITESEFTLQYYYASTVESDWEPGSPYRYLISGNEAIVGQVLEAEPPRRLVMTFDARWDPQVAADPPSRIAWELTDAGPGVVQLTVVHDGLVAGSATAEQIGGMAFVLSGLKTLLETGEPLMSAQGAAVA